MDATDRQFLEAASRIVREMNALIDEHIASGAKLGPVGMEAIKDLKAQLQELKQRLNDMKP